MSFNPLKSLKKLGKGIARRGKKIVKGIHKRFKSAFKEVKRFATSDLGKLVIASALIYFGGAAIAGQLGSATSTAAATTGTSTAVGAAPGAAVGAEVGAGVAAGAVETGAAVANPLAAEVATGQSLAEVGGASLVPPPVIAPPVTPPPSMLSKIGTGLAKHPGLALVGAGQITSALTQPDPGADAIALEKWRRENSNIAGVDFSGGGAPLGGSRRTPKSVLESSTRRYS